MAPIYTIVQNTGVCKIFLFVCLFLKEVSYADEGCINVIKKI